MQSNRWNHCTFYKNWVSVCVFNIFGIWTLLYCVFIVSLPLFVSFLFCTHVSSIWHAFNWWKFSNSNKTLLVYKIILSAIVQYPVMCVCAFCSIPAIRIHCKQRTCHNTTPNRMYGTLIADINILYLLFDTLPICICALFMPFSVAHFHPKQWWSVVFEL